MSATDNRIDPHMEGDTGPGAGGEPRPPLALRYGVAALAVAAVVALRLALWPLLRDEIPFIPFAPAIIIAAWYGGIGAGLAATILSALAADYFLLEPYYSPFFSTPSHLAGLVVFGITGSLISLIVESVRAAHAQLQAQAETLQAANDRLTEARREADRRADEAREGARILQALMEHIPEGITIADAPDVRIRVVSRYGRELTGRPREVIEGIPVERHAADWGIFRPDGTQPSGEELPLSRATQHGEVVMDEEWILRHPDGTEIAILINAGPIRDENGRATGGVMAWRDITERKWAEARLRILAGLSAALAETPAEEEVVRRVAATATAEFADYAVVALVDENGDLRPAAASGSDRDRQRRIEALGPFVFHPATLARMPVLGKALRDKETVLVAEVTDAVIDAVAENGQQAEALRALRATSAIVGPLAARDRLLGSVALIRAGNRPPFNAADRAIADQFIARAALALDNARLFAAEQKAREEAQEANRAKDRFVALVSHELRNPLNAIASGITLLRQSCPATGPINRALEIAERNTALQTRLIDDLLDLSRLHRGKLQLQRAPVELGKVVAGACQSHDVEAKDAGLALACRSEPGLWVHGDFDRLQQVVLNFLSNALKFTPAGGTVTVTAERRGTHGRTTVADTGIGLGRAMLDSLFEMFHQGEVAGQRKEGLGIGLALVKGIVESHGGRVWAESEGIGRGSRFIVELPLVAAPRRQVVAAEEEEAPRRAIGVLLIEDNADTRALIADNLTLAGYEVQTAESGEDALDFLQEGRPDVMLVDIGLPGMDGFEFLRRARELPGMADVPAFAVTGFGAEEDMRRGREAGFAGHFVKPVSVKQLDESIKEIFGGGGRSPQGRSGLWKRVGAPLRGDQ
ncbi:MAG: response regulator [Armatimonadetes bacterium]|nr:response regulator [Armatimonadota bacterium]